MRSVTVVLEGQEFEVTELRRRDSREWRERLEAEFGELSDAIQGAPDVELTDAQALGNLIRSVMGRVLRAPDIVADFLVDYAPNLKDAVEDGYDSEIIEAFIQVVGLAYPFGSAVQRLATQIGLAQQQTRQS